VILKMIQHLYTLKDDRGEPLNEDASQFLVYLPVPFAGAGWKAIYGNQLDTGSGTHDNPLKSAPWNISVAVNPRSSWTTKLAVFRTDSITKPFIRQQEAGTAPTVFVLGDDSEYCKVGNHWLVGTENTWRAVGYGVWQHACLGLLS